MNLRFMIGLCAVVIGVFGVSLCQPPIPRIAKGEGPADVIVPSINATTQDILMVLELADQAIQVRDLDGLVSSFSKRSR
jgi:hypothetical protein